LAGNPGPSAERMALILGLLPGRAGIAVCKSFTNICLLFDLLRPGFFGKVTAN
jgi:hypothetical protein